MTVSPHYAVAPDHFIEIRAGQLSGIPIRGIRKTEKAFTRSISSDNRPVNFNAQLS